MANLPWLDLSNCNQHHFEEEVAECQSKWLPTLDSQQMDFYFLASLLYYDSIEIDEEKEEATHHEYMSKEHGQAHII